MIVYADICWVFIVLIGDTLDIGLYSINRERKQLYLFTILKLYGLKIISLRKKKALIVRCLCKAKMQMVDLYVCHRDESVLFKDVAVYRRDVLWCVFPCCCFSQYVQ